MLVKRVGRTLQPLPNLPVGKKLPCDEIIDLPPPHLVITSKKHTIIRYLKPSSGIIKNVRFMWRYKYPLLLVKHNSYEIIKPNEIYQDQWFCRKHLYDRVLEMGDIGNLEYKNGKFQLVNPLEATELSIPLSTGDYIFIANKVGHGLFSIDDLCGRHIPDVNFIAKVDLNHIVGYLILAPGDIILHYRDGVTELFCRHAVNQLVPRRFGKVIGVTHLGGHNNES